MHDLNVIDRFMATFIAYIDSGFGLLASLRFTGASEDQPIVPFAGRTLPLSQVRVAGSPIEITA